MKRYSHKNSVVDIVKAEIGQVVDTPFGLMECGDSDYVLTDHLGENYVISEDTVKNEYVEFETNARVKAKWNFEELAAGYMELGQLNQNEDEIYINGTRKIHGLL